MQNQNKQADPQEQEKKAEKELQNQFGSYVEVAKRRFGRTPSLEEVLEIIQENESQNPESGDTTELPKSDMQEIPESGQDLESQEPVPTDAEGESGTEIPEDARPELIDFRVYFGMSEDQNGERQPDENKILYYEHPNGHIYDCDSQCWVSNRPSVLDHLQSRGVNNSERDIVAAILNGVMSDRDFELLSKAGMIGEVPAALWEKNNKLKQLLEQMDLGESSDEEPELEKSADDEYYDSVVEDPEDQEYDDSAPAILNEFEEETGEVGDDVAAEMTQYAQSDSDGGSDQYHQEEYGEDLIAQITEAAAQKALTGMEDQIEQIVIRILDDYLK